MAKLSARGCKEVARWSKEGDLTPEQSETCSWECQEYVLRSDNKLLSKRTVIFREGNQRHTWGWTVAGRATSLEKLEAAMSSKGFTKVGG